MGVTGRPKPIATEPGSMSVDSDAEAPAEATTDVTALGRELGEAIAELPEYEAFEEARADVQADDEVQAEIQAFERKRQEFAQARQSGEANQGDLMELQAAQQELHSMPTMEEFLEAQSELTDRLETINRAISEPLVVDFGGEAGGCCHD